MWSVEESCVLPCALSWSRSDDDVRMNDTKLSHVRSTWTNRVVISSHDLAACTDSNTLLINTAALFDSSRHRMHDLRSCCIHQLHDTRSVVGFDLGCLASHSLCLMQNDYTSFSTCRGSLYVRCSCPKASCCVDVLREPVQNAHVRLMSTFRCEKVIYVVRIVFLHYEIPFYLIRVVVRGSDSPIMSEEAKARGNALFGQKKYAEAIAAYTEGLAVVRTRCMLDVVALATVQGVVCSNDRECACERCLNSQYIHARGAWLPKTL